MAMAGFAFTSFSLDQLQVTPRFRILDHAHVLPSGIPPRTGDMIAGTLALLPLITLPSAAGVVVAWGFNLWGSVDLLDASARRIMLGAGPGRWEPRTSFRLSSCSYC